MKIGYNEIMITSMYFDDIKDFINLEIGIKRFQGNIERFHFNPIPLNEYSRKLFANIETFHIYNKYDEIFNDGKYLNKNKYGNIISSEVKSLGYECFYNGYELTTINIPSSISEIGYYCFDGCSSLTSINIPSSISKLGDRCFYKCTSLTSINIPSSITSFGWGCFYKCGCEKELKKNKRIPRNCFNK
ncbi:hypothetical protein EDI_331560 [Entamoeba dispar SAW760]|uniref:Leucine rich repeat containing protein BspA family protein n=1 Tax=Entamoeba dispar (strain ATCC PRA-260 / SAW760) TaxID=370354 RepID=B0EHH8_ENTDS|nr:uncharacterized protein EDI_331560 [Entamoeba dispar SAW760]EDR26018.1 hypothetical protein EDI_331560 [Entamoeba dispar SAW760]|eukprot:EDR26018.1 hypothetical protein EDI_331560 [Entamoeba dispar SAW760]